MEGATSAAKGDGHSDARNHGSVRVIRVLLNLVPGASYLVPVILFSRLDDTNMYVF